MADKAKDTRVKIRLMSDEDIDQVIQLDREITGPNRSLTFSEPVNDYLGGDMTISYVAEVKDKIVGFVMGCLTNIGPGIPNIGIPNVGLVQLVGIRPEWRKKGIAQSLVEAFVKKCKEKKANGVHMLLMSQDKPMRSLFESCGFHSGDVVDMAKRI